MEIYTSPVLVIGNKNYSSWSLRAWLLMRKAEIHFDEVLLPLHTDIFDHEVGKWSPSNCVPVLKDHDRVVWDSLAIAEYINENFAEHKLWPAYFADRAHARSMCCEMHAGFAALKTQMPMNIRAKRRIEMTAPLERDIKRMHLMWRQCRLAHSAAGPWLFGEFSIADAMFAPVVMRFRTYGVDLPKPCAEYMSHVCGDEHVKQWVAEALLETEVVAADEVGVEIDNSDA